MEAKQNPVLNGLPYINPAIVFLKTVDNGGVCGQCVGTFIGRNLIGGQTPGGTGSEAYALDVTQLEWSSIDLSRTGLGARESAAYSYDGSWLYVYGGRRDGQVLDGLYEIELATMIGRRIDASASPAPGVRAEAALRYDPLARTLHLFAGLDASQPRSDLWRYTVTKGTWQQLSPDAASNGPVAMRSASIIPSRRDGAVNVLSGKTEGGASQPVWRLRGGLWKTYGQILEGQ